MGLIDKAEQFLRAARTKHLATRIRYVRPAVGATDGIPATQGSTEWQLDNGSAIVNSRTVDWIINTDDLIINQMLATPRPGDRIEVDTGNDVKVERYEVSGVGGQPCYQWHGRDSKTYRIHTVQIAIKPLM